MRSSEGAKKIGSRGGAEDAEKKSGVALTRMHQRQYLDCVGRDPIDQGIVGMDHGLAGAGDAAGLLRAPI